MTTWPATWTKRTLGSFAEARGGTGFPIALQGRSAGQLPFYKVSDMNADGNSTWMRRANNYISEAELGELGGRVFDAKTIAFPKVGATIYTNKKRILATAAVVDNNVMGVTVKEAKACFPEFLFYWFQSIDLAQLSSPGTVPSITSARVKAQDVMLPPLDEQRQIAAVLLAVQAAIDRQERLITLTGELKKAVMHQLFTEGTRRAPLKHYDLWPIPESWAIRPLGECLALIRNGLTSAQNKTGVGIPVTRIETIADDFVNPERVGFTDAATAAQIESYRLRAGDILMSHINSEPQIGRTAIYQGQPEVLLHGMNLLVLRSNSTMLPAFLHRLCEYLRARGVFQQLASRAVGQSSINQGKIRALLVPCPTLIEQQEICSPLETLEARCGLALRLRESLQQLFGRLLHDLITARVRVHDLDLSALSEAA